MQKRFLFLGIGILLALVGGVFFTKGLVWGNNVVNLEKPFYLKIPNNSTITNIIDSLEHHKVLSNSGSFKKALGFFDLNDKNLKSGRYKITTGMSNRQIIKMIKAGLQSPINLTFNNVRTIYNLASEMSRDIDVDSATLVHYFLDSTTLKTLALDSQTILTNFIPNTYEVKWNISKEQLLDRLTEESKKFWEKEGRMAKLAPLGLSKEQVYTLASIVEKESNLKAERPTVAGVYLNRLKIGDMLRADPTVVFATGDFELRRVLHKHLEIDSPYNTYKYKGLPPGPIYMPSINSIDAVLNAEQHEYLFFCAKPGYNGGHQFAKTFNEHIKNADLYQEWLQKEGIQ